MDEFTETLKRRRSFALAIFVFAGFPFGAADLLLYANETGGRVSEILGLLVSVLAISAWCRFDAGIQNYPLTLGLRLMILLLAVIGVPMYLVRARGRRGAVRVGFGLPPFLASVALYYAGWYMAYWIAGMAGYFNQA